jgi:hypothetical protein
MDLISGKFNGLATNCMWFEAFKANEYNDVLSGHQQYEDGVNVDTNSIFARLIVREDFNSYKLMAINYTLMQIKVYTTKIFTTETKSMQICVNNIQRLNIVFTQHNRRVIKYLRFAHVVWRWDCKLIIKWFVLLK